MHERMVVPKIIESNNHDPKIENVEIGHLLLVC